MKHHVTKAEDKVPVGKKIAYGTGMAAQRLQAGGITQMANPIFNDVLGIDPRIISLMMGFSRVFDAITDPLIGHLTDNTRSRFGRRRPWILLASFLSGISFAAIWLFPRGMSEGFYIGWFLVASMIFYLCLSLFTVPYLAMGMELTPDYHERTSVMAYRAAMSKAGGFFISSLYIFVGLQCFNDMAHGMRYAGIGLAVVIILFSLVPAIFAREHPNFIVSTKTRKINKVGILESSKRTLRHKPFLILIAVTTVMLVGLTMVVQLGYYVIVYYVFDGVKTTETGMLLSFHQYSALIGSLAGIPILTYFSKHFGKRKTLLGAISLALVGTLLKWVCYSPTFPYLTLIPPFVMSFSLVGVWTLVHAMIPDIIDMDELETNERREGMFSAINSWTVKMATSVAIVTTGFILNLSGFDSSLGSVQPEGTVTIIRICYTLIPAVVLLAGFILMYYYPLTEDRAYEIRAELELKRKQERSAFSEGS